jgi:hypothetical protein
MRTTEPVLLSTPRSKEPTPSAEVRPPPPPERPSTNARRVVKRTPPRKAAPHVEETRAPSRSTWEAPGASRGRADSGYERPAAARPPQRPALRPEQQTEEQIVELIKATVAKNPEARKLILEVHREIEALRQLDNLRKF